MGRWLAMSGGGSKGPFHAGFAKGRAEQGIEYDGFAGVSVGAIAAVALAEQKSLKDAVEKLQRLMLTISTSDVHKRWFPFGRLHGLWKSSFRNSAPLLKLLQKSIDGKAVHQSGKKLRLGATAITGEPGVLPDTEEADLAAPTYEVFDETYVPLWEAVAASAAFPGMLGSIPIDGRAWVDGGVQVVTPVSAAIQAGATKLDVVVCEPDYIVLPADEPNAISIMLRSLELMMFRLTWVDVRRAQMMNALITAGDESAEGKRHIEINVVRPEATLNQDSLNFDPEEATRIAQQGYRAAHALPDV